MEFWLFPLIGLLLIFFGVGGIWYFVTIYNGLVRLRNDIEKSWSNIDVLLKQRNDELPNLVATVKGYVAHEKSLLENIAKSRSLYAKAQTVHDKAVADNFLAGTLKTLFAVVENYPELKADKAFLELQDRITGIEDMIADRREYYNDSVNNYNIRIQSIPDVLLATILGYKRKELFKIEDKERRVPEVKFSKLG